MIFGTGLIGGSVGMALRDRGWWVSGVDAAEGVAARAVEVGALSEEGVDHRADLVVVATPVHAAGEIVQASWPRRLEPAPQSSPMSVE